MSHRDVRAFAFVVTCGTAPQHGYPSLLPFTIYHSSLQSAMILIEEDGASDGTKPESLDYLRYARSSSRSASSVSERSALLARATEGQIRLQPTWRRVALVVATLYMGLLEGWLGYSIYSRWLAPRQVSTFSPRAHHLFTTDVVSH
jgi:hypothetical protein